MFSVSDIEKFFTKNVRTMDRGLITPAGVAIGCLSQIMLSEELEHTIRLCSGLPPDVLREIRNAMDAIRKGGYTSMPVFIGPGPKIEPAELQRRWRRIDELLTPWLDDLFANVADGKDQTRGEEQGE